MPRKVDGTSSILEASRWICRIAGRFGTSAFGAATSDEFRAAVDALVIACNAFTALDDHPGEIDESLPLGKEDFGYEDPDGETTP